MNKYKAEAREEALRRDGDLFERVVAELSKREMTDEEALSAQAILPPATPPPTKRKSGHRPNCANKKTAI